MNFKFKERYSSANSLINFKLSLIPEDMIPFFMVDFSPKGNTTPWVNSVTNYLSKNKSYVKYRPTTLMRYISTFMGNYNNSVSELDQFCSLRLFDNYYYNGSTVARSQLSGVFSNNMYHSYKDIITTFFLNSAQFGITQGLFTTIKNVNNLPKIGTPLIMLMVKKDYIPVLKLQMLLDKPVSFEYFEIWLNDEILLLPETTVKTIKTYLINNLDSRVSIKWKSNMGYLNQSYQVPVLETLADKKEWLVNKELELRNKLYGESNIVKTYTINSNDQMIIDSTHPKLQPKPKKFIVELID